MSQLRPASVTHPASSEADAQERRIKGIIQSLRIILGSIQAYSHSIEQQHGISSTQLSALWELKDRPGQKVTDLALSLSIHPSNCSNMIDKLRTKGLVRKSRNGPDERIVRLHLTAKGSELLEAAPRANQAPLVTALGALPPAAVAQLDDNLSSLVAGLRNAVCARKV
jgi:DNA-binding MarR family transcriptional regulator